MTVWQKARAMDAAIIRANLPLPIIGVDADGIYMLVNLGCYGIEERRPTTVRDAVWLARHNVTK